MVKDDRAFFIIQFYVDNFFTSEKRLQLFARSINIAKIATYQLFPILG